MKRTWSNSTPTPRNPRVCWGGPRSRGQGEPRTKSNQLAAKCLGYAMDTWNLEQEDMYEAVALDYM